MTDTNVCPTVRSWFGLFVFPAFFYTLCFFLLTWPIALSFSTRFYVDDYDGLQNVWNLWWVRFSVLKLHQLPWHTGWLHYPLGTSLLGHSLNPFNGFLSIPLRWFLSDVRTLNTIVTFCFVATGLTAFRLARHLTGKYWPSIFGGFVFTFSSYHFAHAQGHLQLISMEFIPLFMLCWLRLLERPTILRAVGCAIVLGLVLLCDHYYFLYCVMGGAIVLLWLAWPAWKNHRWRLLAAIATFCGTTLLTCGPLALALVVTNHRDPFQGAHEVDLWSCDALAPFVPGGAWAFGPETKFYWKTLPGNYVEDSVYLGWSVIGLLITGVIGRCRSRRTWMWLSIGLIFMVFSFGPKFRVWGTAMTGNVMPYEWLLKIAPPLKLSGMPVRMMVMTSLSASMLAAVGMAVLLSFESKTKWGFAAAFALLLCFEILPRDLPLTAPDVPQWVNALRDLPGTGGVIVNVHQSDGRTLYQQSIHQKPMALGYLARVQQSALDQGGRIIEAMRRNDYRTLHDHFGFDYIVTTISESVPGQPKVYWDDNVSIQTLSSGHDDQRPDRQR
jgi:hypothetical protein